VTVLPLHTAETPFGLGPERTGGWSRISFAYFVIQDFHCT
jgi:hypothetical protein